MNPGAAYYDAAERAGMREDVPQPASAAATLFESLTDSGNARRFALQHHGSALFHKALGWLVTDGRRFTPADTGEEIRLAQGTVTSIYQEAALAADEGGRRKIAEHAMRSEAAPRIEAMLKLARAQETIAARVEDFDRDHFALNVMNGTIDLHTGELRPHRREDRMTKLAPVVYDPRATAPVWEQFVLEIMGGRPQLADYLRRIVGYSLTGDTGEQCFFFLYGTGANGKGTLVEQLRQILGDYAQAADFSTFAARRDEGGAPRNDVAGLAGARFVSSAEVEDGRRFAESLVKQLTGGDTVKARFLFREGFAFKPTFKLWISGNHRPIIKGTDNGIWRRVRLVPFDRTFALDRTFPAKLEAEAPGILAWAVRGCLEWQRDGLGEPIEVMEATASYRADMDRLAGFISEICVETTNATATAAQLYRAYKDWCEANGEKAESQRALGLRLKERGFRKGSDSRTNCVVWSGIGMREAT